MTKQNRGKSINKIKRKKKLNNSSAQNEIPSLIEPDALAIDNVKMIVVIFTEKLRKIYKKSPKISENFKLAIIHRFLLTLQLFMNNHCPKL